MFMQKLWWWRTAFDSEMPSLSVTLQVARFIPMTWSMASGSIVFGLTNLACMSRFLQPEQNFFNHMVTVRFIQMFLIASVALWQIYLWGFQITHGVKGCTTCQPTNYHDTTNHRRYLPQLELLHSCDICATNKPVPKYCKTFDSPEFFWLE